jgi:hypothetical protein
MELKEKIIIVGLILLVLNVFISAYGLFSREDSKTLIYEKNLYDKIDTQGKTQLEMHFESCINNMDIQNSCKCVAEGKIEYCEENDDPNQFEFGLWLKAKATKDSKYCDEIAEKNPNYSNLHNCYSDTAKTVEDCEKIDFSDEPYEIYECLAYATKDSSYCENELMPLKDKNSCLASFQEENCNDISDFGAKWYCLFENSDDPDICQKYHNNYCNFYYK